MTVQHATEAAEDQDTDAIVEVKELTKRFGGLVANRDIGITIPRRASCRSSAPTAPARRRFFNVITGSTSRPRQHHASTACNIVGLAPHEVAKLGIARTFQNIRLFADMTALENVMVGRHVRTQSQWSARSSHAAGSSARRRRRAKRAHELLDYVGIAATYERLPGART